MPEHASAGVSVTVVSLVRQPAGASSVDWGAPASMRTVTLCASSALPASSVLA